MLTIRFSTGDRLEYEGPGEIEPLDNEGVQIRFGYEDRNICWQVWPDHLVILSRHDVAVRLPLQFGQVCKGQIDSPWGTLEMEAVLKHYEWNETLVTVCYEMEGSLCCFRLEWIKEQ